MHRLGFLGDDLPDGCVSESNGGLVRFGTINASFVWDKIHPPSKYVRRLIAPFLVHCRI